MELEEPEKGAEEGVARKSEKKIFLKHMVSRTPWEQHILRKKGIES